MNLLWRPTSKGLGRQKYNENTTATERQADLRQKYIKGWVVGLARKSD